MDAIIRILLTEHNAALQDGIAALIEGQPDMQIVFASGDAQQALDEFRRMRPAVAVVDVDVFDSINLMKRLRREHPQTKVIALVTYEWDHIAEAAAKASGGPCLPKDHISRRLVAMIRG